MRKAVFWVMIFVLENTCFSWELKHIKTIPMHDEKTPLLVSGAFVVLEDGCFLFTDIRDEKSQFKVFNEEGRLIKAWGEMGPGPDEFGGLASVDYQSPHLCVLDAGKQRIHVFDKSRDYELKKIAEVPAWEANNHIKLYNNYILINGYIVSPKGKKYVLFMRDFSGKETKYLLPVENQYGAGSSSGHEEIQKEISGVSSLAFIDFHDDTIFYVSDIRLKIAKIHVGAQKIEFIGKAPRNFRSLVMNKKTRTDLMRPQTGKKVMEEILSASSFVSGIFADKDVVGVIYVNREKKIGAESYFLPSAQVYDHSGNLLNEQSLGPFYSEEKFTPLFYQEDKRLLYLLSMISDEAAYRYTIYVYSMEP